MGATYGAQGNSLGAQQQAYLERLMTEQMAQRMIFDKFLVNKTSLPQKSGSKIKFRKWVPMRELFFVNDIYKNYTGNNPEVDGSNLAVLVPKAEYNNYVLPEGSSGSEVGSLKVVELETDIIPIGMWMGVTEEVNLLHDMYTTAEHIRQYSEVGSLVLDGFYRDVLANGAGHVIDISADGDGSDNVKDQTFVNAVRRISLQLRLSGARYINEIMTSSPNFGTTPIWARYIGVINTMAGESLKDNPSFVPVEKYADKTKLLDGEIGVLGDVRFIENEDAFIEKKTDGANTWYECDVIVMGKEHTQNIPLRGKGRVEVIVKGLGENGDDPLNRKQTVGWKTWLGALTTNPERLGKIRARFDLI